MQELRRAQLRKTYDIAVVGSGFGGSLLAAIARQLGKSVVLLEKGTHPRVVIGESSTPLSNLLLEELAVRYGLDELKPLSKWGTWQRSYPQIACGLKRGFTFHHHVVGSPAAADPERGDQLLVAASPRDEISDTHWYRAAFDHLLVREALGRGVEYIDQVALNSFTGDGSVATLHGERGGCPVRFDAKFVVDATGPRGFLHKALGLGEGELPGYPATQALYSHFGGVGRLDATAYSRVSAPPPYPIDDAAVHHVFDGGWVWVLRFNNGVVSAGLAATDTVAARLRLSEGASAWQRLLEWIPALKQQFAAAEPLMDFVHMPRMAFRSAQAVGPHWAQLPSAAGFVDPLLSTGIPLTLLGVSRLAAIVDRDWQTPRWQASLGEYARTAEAELLITASLIAALYANMHNFPVFTALTMLYFAAASFAEAARRLEKPHLAQSFMLCQDARFGPVLAALLRRAQQPLTGGDADKLVRDIEKAIEPINVTGLCNPELKNWYPAAAQDLIASREKLGAGREEMLELIERCGL